MHTMYVSFDVRLLACRAAQEVCELQCRALKRLQLENPVC